jgi:hypothetical protein
MTKPDSLNDEPPMTSHRDTLLEVKEALEGLLADITEYQTINNLGGENNHWQAASRKALAKLTALLEAPPPDMVGGVQKAILDVWARRPKWERLGPLTRRQAEAAIAAMPAFSWKGWDADAPSKIVDEYHALFEAPPADRVERVAAYVFKKHGQLLTDLFQEVPSDFIADDRAGVASGFIRAMVATAIAALEPRGGEVHLSQDQQQAMHNALKRSLTVVAKPVKVEPARGGDSQPVDIEAGARAIDPSAFGLGLVNNVSLTMQHIARSHAKACATAWGLTYVD